MMTKQITSAELRTRFLEFFKRQGHVVKESDSLIPSGDATVLFTSAGMNQFKDYFLGKRTDLSRAASAQKCLRAGDLDKVGKSASHHSFFEMLGNFSFGDYFKREAIQWGWEFLTGTVDFKGTPSPHQDVCVSLPGSKLWVSVYEEDEEAETIWREVIGLPKERIARFGQADNFWPANAPKEGPNGPCGPCSEIYFDANGQVKGPASLEVWNLVFTQFDRQSDGSLKPLPRKSIDTGMGLERLTRVIQGTPTDYETDLFAPIIEEIQKLVGGSKLKGDRKVFAERAIADHIRASVFLIADGVLPSNESRGYVLRMLIRRAHRLGRSVLGIDPERTAKYTSTLGIKDPEPRAFLYLLVRAVEEGMGDAPYFAPGDLLKAFNIARVIEQEEAKFIETLDSGGERVQTLIDQTRAAGRTVVPGDEVFKLYDTYGFPLEITIDIAQEQGLTVDETGFRTALKAQQERSRSGSQFSGGVFAADALAIRTAIQGLPAKEAHFVGYDAPSAEARVKGLWDGAVWVEQAREGQQVGIVLDRSPFYGEAGGQIGDTGRIDAPKGVAEVSQTVWADDVLVHHATVRQGRVSVNDSVKAIVDAERRLKVARSHTAAHLLHWALRKVLGPETVQAGSFVETDRVRFDFSSLTGMQEAQRHEVEALVNRRVRLADEVRTAQMSVEEAKRGGALALFGEKYGSKVRVVTIGDYSKELCGGTHLPHTGFVGSFLIMGESSIAAGTRRIEALVGDSAAEQHASQRRILQELAHRLSRPVADILTGFDEVLEQLKRAERDRKQLQIELAKVQAPRLAAQGRSIGGITFVTATIDHADRELLTALADAVKAALGGDGVVLLASTDGASGVVWVMAATPGAAKRAHAGQMLKTISAVTQGSGGGRPDFAQGGGKDPSKIPAAMQRAEELLREALAK